MSGEFTVDTQALAKAEKEIRRYAEEYNGIATKLLETATNMGKAYVGEENRAFVSKIEGCTDDLKAMVKKLNQIAEIVKAEKEGYEKLSAHNKEQVGKLQS